MIAPPIEPMLAKLADELPPAGAYLYEPKWDGFRAIVFRGDKDLYPEPGFEAARSLLRTTRRAARAAAEGIVVDGEIVIAGPNGLDFDALQLRLHPAESRVAKLAKETPSSFVAFDLLFWRTDLRATPQSRRRELLEKVLGKAQPPLFVTPTRDRAAAVGWLTRFEGAGLDGVIAKPSRVATCRASAR